MRVENNKKNQMNRIIVCSEVIRPLVIRNQNPLARKIFQGRIHWMSKTLSRMKARRDHHPRKQAGKSKSKNNRRKKAREN